MEPRDKGASTRDKVLSILGEARPRAPVEAPPAAAVAGHRVRGSNNIIGNSNTIVIHEQIVKPKVVVHPGEAHISQEQARELTNLVKDIVAREKRIRPEPAGYQAVWGALNDAMGVTRYLLIPRRRFDEAKAFLLEWQGYLEEQEKRGESPAVAARRSRLEYINKLVAQLSLGPAWARWMAVRYPGKALTDLNSDELWLAYQALQEMIEARGPPQFPSE